MIAPVSTPAYSVPNAMPQSPPKRDAQNASATAGSPWRTSSEPCSTSASDSTSRRARYSIPSRSVSSLRTRSTASSSRASPPAASSTSSKNAATDSGCRPIARSASSAATLPEPSQIDISGASR